VIAVGVRSGWLVTLFATGWIVVRRPTDGLVLGALADDTALTGQDSATEGAGGTAVDQDGALVVRALPATAPSQDRGSGATMTGGLVALTVRDRL